MRKFDYSFLNSELLPANLINITGVIYSLKTGNEIRKDEYEKIFTEEENKLVILNKQNTNTDMDVSFNHYNTVLFSGSGRVIIQLT